MVWRVKFNIGGGHVHCRLFCAAAENHTFAKCGEFCVRKGAEFVSLLRVMGGVQFIGDNDRDGIDEASKD